MRVDERGGLAIRTEEDAWRALEQLLRGQVTVANPQAVQLVRWPRLKITVQQGEAIILPSMMEGFVDFQRELYRSHMLIQHGRDDLRKLTNDEKNGLEFAVKVSRGSSIYEVDLGEVLQKVALAAVDKMDPLHIALTLLGMATIWGSYSAFRAFLQTRLEERKAEIQSRERRDLLEAQRFAAEQETQRMRIFAQAVRREPSLDTIRSHADAGKHALLGAVAFTDGARVNGVDIPGEVASELRKSVREDGAERTIAGTYRIMRVDTTSPEGFRVRVQNLATEDQVTVGVDDAVRSEGLRDRIRTAEWAKRSIRLSIRGVEKGGRLTDGTIVAAELVNEPRA